MRLKLAKNSRTINIGSKRSPFKGQGLKFKDHQIYSYGDDVRFIDWKVTAKTNVPYVKVFEEEKNQGIDVIIDASRSMSYGWNNISKFEVAIQILCLFYLWSDLTKDKIRGIILSGNGEIIDLPKTTGRTGIGYLLQSLLKRKIIDEQINFNLFNSDNLPINDEEMIKKNMYFLMKIREKKNHLVIMSDFYNFLNEKSIQYISNSIDALNLIQILSPIDLNLEIKYPVLGYFSKDQSMKRRNLFGYINDISLKLKINKNTFRNVYQVNIGEKCYLEKFAQKIK
ncbi:MAG: DUF58 domain-containing protein [Oligoflexia bacterium]|nr:DUF58 domain-containing protein [Oligoflexia bacterium]